MKIGNPAAFEKHLKGSAPDHFAASYLILSKEPFERREAETLLLRLLSAEAECKSFSAEKLQPAHLLDELNTAGMFQKRSVVLLRDPEKGSKALREALENYLENPNPTALFVMVSSGLRRDAALYKKTEKHGVVADFPEMKPWQKEKMMAGWLQEEAKKRGKGLEPAAGRQLAQQIGTDRELLMRELEKLVCHAGEGPVISCRDISLLCSSNTPDDVWKFGEALFQRNGALAMKIGKALLERESGAFLGLLRQLRGQFQTEFQVAAILAGGGAREDIVARFPYMRQSFILDRHIGMARGYGFGALKKGLLFIDKTELQAKSSAADPESLLEILIARLV